MGLVGVPLFPYEVDKRPIWTVLFVCVLLCRIRSVPYEEGIAVFPRSLKVAIAGIRSLTVGRRSDPAFREPEATPYKGEQSVADLRKPAAYQQAARDLEVILDRYSVAS